jgi:hypothetical protein
MLLNAFTPGYVLTQIPAAAMINAIGAKAVLNLNNLGMLAAMLLLPVATRSGATAVAACFALLGVVQGPYVTAATWMTKHWVPVGPERPLGIMVIRNGSNIAKVLATALTPVLSGRFGWRAVPAAYGAFVGLYTGAWTALSASQPPPPPAAAAGSAGVGAPAPAAKPLPFDVRLLCTRPALALFGVQLAHNLGEFHVFGVLAAVCSPPASPSLNLRIGSTCDPGPWIPTYFIEVRGRLACALSPQFLTRGSRSTVLQGCLSSRPGPRQVLGVAPQAVGHFAQWPVLVAIFAKLVVGLGESRCLSAGWSQLQLRKAAVTTASTLVIAGTALFNSARVPWVAALGQVIVFTGSSFDSQAGFLPNTLEVAGPDIGYFGSCLNTGALSDFRNGQWDGSRA